MKGFIITLAVSILCQCFALAQQTIVSGEYFIDEYVDFGNGTPLEVSQSADLTVNTAIDVGALTPGLHQLYLRFKNSEGVWSHTYARVFLKPEPSVQSEAAGFEYFFDSYTGIGEGNFMTLEEGKDLYTVSTDGLAPGLHVLYIRTKSSAGKWSLVNEKVFYVPEQQETINIVRLEYFFKDAEGNLTSPQSYTDFTPAPTLELQGTDFVANTSDLAAGQNYTIYVRAFTEDGTPSLYSSTTFALRTVTAIRVTSIETTEVDCGETATGMITVNATGGEGTLQYSIDGENYTTSNSFDGLAAGEYTVYIKGNVEGYVESREVEVTAKEMPETPVLEVENNEGGILLSVSNIEGDLQWYKDGAPVDGATANSLAVEAGGSYYVTVTNEAGCTAASEPFSVTSLENNYLSQATLVYPNPAVTELFILLPEQVQPGKEMQLHLYDLQGAVVAVSEFSYVADQPVNLKLPALSKGMYLLRLWGEDLVIVKKVQIKGH